MQPAAADRADPGGAGLADPEVAARFLAPRLADLRPPEGMADLTARVDRLTAALDRGERIGVFGDYDVDGVTTAAVLALALRALGANGGPAVASRFSGYGFGPPTPTRFVADGCERAGRPATAAPAITRRSRLRASAAST